VSTSSFLTIDIFLMPHLLFMAAFFIFYSLKSKTSWEYIKKRFFRLCIPVFVFVFCAGDIYYQLLVARVTGSDVAYLTTFLDYWYACFHKIFMLNQVGFGLFHLWFLSFLFPITVITVLLNRAFKKKEKEHIEIENKRKIITKTIILAILLGIFYAALAVVFYINNISFDRWLILIGTQVRLNQFFELIPLFLFGLYVYKKDWLTRGNIGTWQLWGVLSAILIFLRVVLFQYGLFPILDEICKVAEHNLTMPDKLTSPPIPTYFEMTFLITNFLRAPICIFLLMFLLALAKKFFNKQNAVTAFCSKHSINVYILHFIPVILLQYLFKDMPVAPVIKVMLMMIIVIPASLWLSYRLVYPHPIIAIAFFVILKLIALFVGFDFYYIALLVVTFISFAGAIVEFIKYLVLSRTIVQTA